MIHVFIWCNINYSSSYIISVVIIITSIGGQNLFCYSKSLMESLQLVTPYCIFTGNFTLKALLHYIRG